jgi:hypothetical protein
MDTMVGVQERNKDAFSRNIGCRKNRGIARDLLYAEPELGAGHSQPSLSPALLTSISSCTRPRTMLVGQSRLVEGSSCSH